MAMVDREVRKTSPSDEHWQGSRCQGCEYSTLNEICYISYIPSEYLSLSDPPYPPSAILILLLKISARLPRRMLQVIIDKLLAREFARADLSLVLMRCDAVFSDGIAMTVFNRFGDIGGVGGFVAVAWLGGIWSFLGGRGGRRGRGGGRGWRG